MAAQHIYMKNCTNTQELKKKAKTSNWHMSLSYSSTHVANECQISPLTELSDSFGDNTSYKLYPVR